MKIVVIAKYNLTVNVNGRELSIVKGDKFTLYGTVFAYKDVIVDITKVAQAFDIVKEPGQPAVQTYEFIAPVVINNCHGSISFAKGDKIRTVSDVVYVNGVVLRLENIAYALKVVVEPVEPEVVDLEDDIDDNGVIDASPAPAEPVVPGAEGTEPAAQGEEPANGEEPAAPANVEEPANGEAPVEEPANGEAPVEEAANGEESAAQGGEEEPILP